MRSNHTPDPHNHFIVGRHDDSFYSFLLELEDDEDADRSDWTEAWTFTLLDDAIGASTAHGGSVFEVVDSTGSLRELKIDLGSVASVPFEGCYGIGSQFFVGPTPVVDSVAETRERIDALIGASVTVIVNLTDRAELFWQRRNIRTFDHTAPFKCHFYPIRDGDAPSGEQMQEILNTIEDEMEQGRTVYLHCVGGRGRSGTVAGCLLARQSVASGIGALNYLAEVRFTHGLFAPSPETASQRQMVINWEACH